MYPADAEYRLLGGGRRCANGGWKYVMMQYYCRCYLQNLPLLIRGRYYIPPLPEMTAATGIIGGIVRWYLVPSDAGWCYPATGRYLFVWRRAVLLEAGDCVCWEENIVLLPGDAYCILICWYAVPAIHYREWLPWCCIGVMGIHLEETFCWRLMPCCYLLMPGYLLLWRTCYYHYSVEVYSLCSSGLSWCGNSSSVVGDTASVLHSGIHWWPPVPVGCWWWGDALLKCVWRGIRCCWVW